MPIQLDNCEGTRPLADAFDWLDPTRSEVVLYCTYPDEITSAREALRLRRRDIRKVRPLQGDFSAWRTAQFPVELRGPVVRVDDRILNAA